jgi:acyl-CoA reductase-like NAD-dependent aldehyde dehydrogenase
MLLFSQEQFGPVVPVAEFEDISEILIILFSQTMGASLCVWQKH